METRRFSNGSVTAATPALLFCLLLCACNAQAPAAAAAPGPQISETSTKAVPRLADGHPDLNGTWDNGSGIDFVQPQKAPDGSICVAGCDPAPGAQRTAGSAGRSPPDRPKYKPQFLQKVKELDQNQVQMDPVLRCRSPGLPRIGPPDKIVQIPGQVVFLYDDVSGAFFRIIPTDGRPHRAEVEDTYLGDSVGRWEGDTLVIEAVNFNEDSWLTDDGAFHTSALRVTERLRRVGDTIEYQAIAEDPNVLAEPWKLRPRILKLTTQELVEPAPCVDRDLQHIVDGTHHDNPR